MARQDATDDPDTMIRHINVRRRSGWRAKLDPMEWWYWFQGKRMDRFFGRSAGPIRKRRMTTTQSARVGTEMMAKGQTVRKRSHE